MNAPATPGLFADRLPPRAPTLADLADRVIAAHAVREDCPDAQWDAADNAVFDAEREFLAVFHAQTGIDALKLSALSRTGVL